MGSLRESQRMGWSLSVSMKTHRQWMSVALSALFLGLLFAPPGLDREVLLPAGTLLLLVASAALSVAHRGGHPLTPPRSLLAMAGLWTLALMLSTAAGTSATILGVITHACWVVLLWLGWWLGGDSRAIAILGRMTGLAAVVVAAICLAQMVDIPIWPRTDLFSDRVVGVFSNPNHLGSFCAFALPLASIAFLREPKVGFWCQSGLIYAALLLSGSRGAWISALVAILLLSLWITWGMSGDRRRHAIRRGLVLIATWAATTLALSERPVLHSPDGILSVSERLQQTGEVLDADGRDRDRTLQHRLLLWSAAGQMIQQEPFLGVGPGGFESAYAQSLPALRQLPQYKRLEIGLQRDRARFAHNEALHVTAEQGILGLVALTGILMLPLATGLRTGVRWPNHLWYQGGVVAVLSTIVHGLVSYPLHIPTTSVLIFISLGIICRSPSPDDRIRLE